MPAPADTMTRRSMRAFVLDSSTVTTCTSVDVELSNGRANAKHATKNQYDGLSAAQAVMRRPTNSVRRIMLMRPQRSAREANGNAPSEAKRRIARPMPNCEPDRPTTL